MNLPKIDHALENIISACESRLSELYPAGIPKDILSRYQKELSFLKRSSSIDEFELFRRFSAEAKKSTLNIHMRGHVSGSILYYLLSNNSFNPLPPSYYCKKCGFYETVDTDLFGIDLPAKKCPHCDSEILADGFYLPIESVWGGNGEAPIYFEYDVNSEFLPFAKRILKDTYPNNQIVPWGAFEISSDSTFPYHDEHIIGVRIMGYTILPFDRTIENYSDLISYLDNGDPCIVCNSRESKDHMLYPVHLVSNIFLDDLLQLQRNTGIYINEIGLKELREITWNNIHSTITSVNSLRSLFYEFKAKNYKDMVSLEASDHNTYTFTDQSKSYFPMIEYKEMISTPAFQKYPCFTREDFLEYLIDTGTEPTLAFEIVKKIRLGHADRSHRRYQEFMELPIPDELKEVAQNYLYIFPRAHCIELILLRAKLAYYAKIDGRTFNKIIFKKR